MIMEIVSILLGILILLGFSQEGGLHQLAFTLIDLSSLAIILMFTVPVLVRGGVWKDFKRAFLLLKRGYSCHLSELRRTQDVLEMLQKQVVCAGIMAMLLTFIIILRTLSDLHALGPNLAVAILTVLYATIIEMLLLPLHLEVKRRIIDYMELDGETGAMRRFTPISYMPVRAGDSPRGSWRWRGFSSEGIPTDRSGKNSLLPRLR